MWFAIEPPRWRNAAGKPLRASLLSSVTALIAARTLVGVPEKSAIHALCGFHRSAPPLVHPIRFRISKDQRGKGGQIMEKRKSPVLENIVGAGFPHPPPEKLHPARRGDQELLRLQVNAPPIQEGPHRQLLSCVAVVRQPTAHPGKFDPEQPQPLLQGFRGHLALVGV